MADKFNLPVRYQGIIDCVWIEYRQLADDYKPVNLGPGFPNFKAAPDHLIKYLVEGLNSNHLLNQYTRGFGHPRLVKVIGEFFSKFINRHIDSHKEVLVTVGAHEALYCAIQGNINPGDEVVILEPHYDCYAPMVQAAGGKPVFVPLKNKNSNSDNASSADWVVNPDELAEAFNHKTKLFMLNNPNNPLGKVFTRDELTVFADLCKNHNVVCIADEVYQWLVYEPAVHISIATLPGMWERTITVGSAGKTFSVTGWKLGWAFCPEKLMKNLRVVHQNCVHSFVTPIQEAVARSFEYEFPLLGTPNSYFKHLSDLLQLKRDYFCKVLKERGLPPIIPEAGYFIICNFSDLADKVNLSSEADLQKDFKFTKWMAKNVKLLGIPTSAFYTTPLKHLGENHVRFCFFKTDETLEQAESILKKWEDSHRI